MVNDKACKLHRNTGIQYKGDELMKFHKLLPVLAGVTSLTVTSFSQATFLVSTDGLTVYDTVADVTWLRDGNYAMTSGYDSDGLMNWTDAMNWADSLTIGTGTNWHLPTITTSSGGGPRPSENGQTTPTDANEFGWLWEQQRNGDSSWSADEAAPFVNIPYFDSGLSEYYWTSIIADPDGLTGDPQAWNFLIDCACWGTASQSNEYYAWAVHDGNVTGGVVPEPSTLLLIATGLAGFGFVSKKKRS